jgi:hypothetical protein
LLGHELSDYTVRNLGFVGAAATGKFARLWLRPKFIRGRAVAGSIHWLELQSAKRFCVTTYDNAWNNALYPDAASAIQAIIRSTLAATPRSADFIRERRRLDSLELHSPFAQLLRQWKDTDAGTDRARLAPTLTHALLDRYLLVDVSDCEPIIQGYGQGMDMARASWNRVVLGGRLRDAYDYEYGSWSAQAYCERANIDEPVIEDCDVIVNLPGRPRKRVTYRRLIMPLRTLDSSRLLLGASVLNTNGCVRLQTDQDL